MTTPEILNHPHTRRTITALSLPGLIRLISEIDDNGPITRGNLGVTFDDLTRHQLRHALDTARDFGVVYADEQTPARYRLTRSGEDLAEVYDTAARWARTHQYPSASSDFVTRVQHALKLLSHAPVAVGGADRIGKPSGLVANGLVPDLNAAFALEGPESALADWLQAHPWALRQTATRPSHALDETEHAA